MPRPGFTSVTLPEREYKIMHSIYSKHKNELRIIGISTFSAFVRTILLKFVRERQIKDMITDDIAKHARELWG